MNKFTTKQRIYSTSEKVVADFLATQIAGGEVRVDSSDVRITIYYVWCASSVSYPAIRRAQQAMYDKFCTK